MTKALEEALAAVERLPAADQENIGRQVLHHVVMRQLNDGALPEAGIYRSCSQQQSIVRENNPWALCAWDIPRRPS